MIGQTVHIIVDRPLGSRHPNHPDLFYPVNYGYIPGIVGGDGEEQDVYILGIYEPLSAFTGRVVGIVRRFDDVEEKWIAVPEGLSLSPEEIRELVWFQEHWFSTEFIFAD